MTDYVPTEIVVFSDNEVVSFDFNKKTYEFYKGSYFLNVMDNGFGSLDSINGSGRLSFQLHSVDSDYKTTVNLSDYILTNYPNLKPTEIGSKFVVSSTIFECYLSSYGYLNLNGTAMSTSQGLLVNDSVSVYGTASYVKYSAYNALGTLRYSGYFKVPNEYLPTNYLPPVMGDTIISGSDIFWLYNFGRFLVQQGSYTSDILNLSVGSTNLLTLLFGAGFLIYAGWVLLKWIIPV